MIKLFRYLKAKDWALIAVSVCFIVLQVFLDLKMPEYTAELTRVVQSGNSSMSEVWKNGGFMLLCAGGSLISAIFCAFLITNVASSFSKNLRSALFNKISNFSDAEIKKFSVPSLITRTTNDVMQMQNFMAMGVQMMIKAPVTAIWAICKISASNLSWTLAVVICVVVIVVCISILMSICIPRFKRIQKLTDEVNNVTRESISGVRVIRAFNAEDYQTNRFENVNKKITSNHLFVSRSMGVMSPVMTICLNGLTLAIYVIGALLINDIVFNGDIGALILERANLVGNMAAFTQYAMQVVMSFMMLIAIFIFLPRTIVCGNRINAVLKQENSILYSENNINSNMSGEVEFKNVCFSYADEENNEKTLENISFKINKGETLAIIGATGSAKSTLINLIPRLYDVTSGEILVDGINVKRYKEKELRDKIALASQKAVLFKGTIKENITFGSEKIDEEKIQEVIEIAQAGFINELDRNIESEVSQGGTNFSGGQKQRISIARALYKDAEIIIFDDTFSALDYKTDMLVRKAIKEKLTDKTIIIVAQRIGTIKNADKILVLDEGKIVGEGTHSELIESCDLYKEIALSQLSKEEI